MLFTTNKTACDGHMYNRWYCEEFKIDVLKLFFYVLFRKTSKSTARIQSQNYKRQPYYRITPGTRVGVFGLLQLILKLTYLIINAISSVDFDAHE